MLAMTPKNSHVSVMFVLTAGIAFLPSAMAQFDLSWHTVDGGGHMFSAGGAFELGGTIGQPDASSFSTPMTGGPFELVGGFWPAAAAPACNPCDANCDGSVNAFDIQPFVDSLAPSPPTPCSPCASDTNGDGSLNGFDIQGFVDCLGG